MSNETSGLWGAVKGVAIALKNWWQSDALSSKSFRIPLKLAVVAAVGVIALAVGSYGAGKLRAYAGDEQPVTQTQFSALRDQMVSACSPPAPVVKTISKKTSKR